VRHAVQAPGVTFAIAMTPIDLSGVAMTWHMASLPKAFAATLVCGTITTALVVLLSV